MVDVLRLDDDTAIVPSLIVRVELIDAYVNMFTTSVRHQEWQVVVTTTGGATFVVARAPYAWLADDADQRADASTRAKDEALVAYGNILGAIGSL